MADFLNIQKNTPKNDGVCARQIAFFCAFILPIYKLVETPSILSKHAGGDLLFPALLQFVSQLLAIVPLLIASSRCKKPLLSFLNEKLGKWSILFYLFYVAFFLFAAILPLLDLEKFVYAVFYDTSPTFFSFIAFFILSAYISAKGITSVGRCADLSLFLFVIPFFALIIMGLFSVDFSHLLPFFEKDFSSIFTAMQRTTPHFIDTALLLPLIGNLSYQKGDGKKIIGGYALGASFTLLFLAVFFGIFSSVSLREHYAFTKIAQHFPVLSVVGRIDLLFVYTLSIILFFYVSFPLQYATDFSMRLFGPNKRRIFAAAFSVLAFVFVLFCNKYYNTFYQTFSVYLPPVFMVGSNLIPALLLLIVPKKSKKEKEHAQHT